MTIYPSNPVLLVDDERAALNSFSMILEANGITNVVTCQDSKDVADIMRKQHIAALFLDLNMPAHSGEEILEWVMEEFPETQVLVVTGNDDIDTAVSCMRKGAFDFLVKPIEEDRLISSLRKALEVVELRRACHVLKQSMLQENSLQNAEAFSHILTRSPAMMNIFKYLEAVRESRQPVLITGESGTGKELLARAVHALSSPAPSFVSVNVAGLDDTMFSDTMFGHVKGAYTGAETNRKGMIEEAAGGILFLDEIGDLSPASQVKLLRLLQEGEYFPLGTDQSRVMNARLVFATNADLEGMVAQGVFRKDLYYRIYTHHVQIPPLRERHEDVELLLHHFVESACIELGQPGMRIEPELLALLACYDFPGNIRELQAMVYDAVSVCGAHGTLGSSAFSNRLVPTESACWTHSSSESTCMLFPPQLPTLDEMREELVNEAMRRAGGKQVLACKMLGISQPALSKRLKLLRRTG